MNLSLILKLVPVALFTAWAAFTEWRLRQSQAKTQEVALALKEIQNKDANAALSDADARSKLGDNLRN